MSNADKVIVVWSPAASASQWVRAEAGEGLERRVLVPVLIEPTRIPLEFRRIQTLDLTDWDGVSASTAISGLVGILKDEKTTPSGHRAQVAPARVPATTPSTSAEVLSASKYTFNVRIRLQLCSSAFTVRHVNRLIFQVVKVNGRTVSRSPAGLMHEHHRFRLPASEGEHEADLFMSGEATSGLKGVVLNIDGREVLRERVRWTDGLVGAVGYVFILGSFTLAWGAAVDPLIASTAVALFAYFLVALVVTVLWFAVG